MRIVCIVVGALIVVLGASAVVTGEFAVHAGWLLASGFAAVGFAGLLANARAQFR